MATSGKTPSPDTGPHDLQRTIHAGVEACRLGDWEHGLELLWKASHRADEGYDLPAVFYSYTGFGIARHQRRLEEGERLCRHAVRLDPSDPEHLLLLAKVCFLRRNRKAAVEALLKGLKLAPQDPALRRFQRRIGYRRLPVIRFLHRDNPLNELLGRWRHRRHLGN